MRVGSRSNDTETLPCAERPLQRRTRDINLDMPNERRALSLHAELRRMDFRRDRRRRHDDVHLRFREDRLGRVVMGGGFVGRLSRGHDANVTTRERARLFCRRTPVASFPLAWERDSRTFS